MSSSEAAGVGISLVHSATLEVQETGSGGESKKESLITGVSAKTKANADQNSAELPRKESALLVNPGIPVKEPVNTKELVLPHSLSVRKGRRVGRRTRKDRDT
jgi:hypothetical protein